MSRRITEALITAGMAGGAFLLFVVVMTAISLSGQQLSSKMSEEIPMYCCLAFSYAVHYGFITIDTERIEAEIRLQSSLSESEKKELKAKLVKEYNTNMDTDHFL